VEAGFAPDGFLGTCQEDRSRLKKGGTRLMSTREDFNHQVRRIAVITLALAACLIFGIIVLASNDWIPGGIIVAASVVALAREIPVIGRLCSTDLPPAPPAAKPLR
jgi:hypothetical protein